MREAGHAGKAVNDRYAHPLEQAGKGQKARASGTRPARMFPFWSHARQANLARSNYPAAQEDFPNT